LEAIHGYNYGTVPLPPPWQHIFITFAVDIDSGVRFVGVAPLCDVLALHPEAQIIALQRAAQTQVRDTDEGPQFAIDPANLRKITMQGKRGPRPMVCLALEEVGWWFGHIPPNKVAYDFRDHLDQFQRALRLAADRLFWRNTGSLTLPLLATREPATVSSCQHDGPCPTCGQWIRVATQDGQTEWLPIE
jgi:hypothetical protein